MKMVIFLLIIILYSLNMKSQDLFIQKDTNLPVLDLQFEKYMNKNLLLFQGGINNSLSEITSICVGFGSGIVNLNEANQNSVYNSFAKLILSNAKFHRLKKNDFNFTFNVESGLFFNSNEKKMYFYGGSSINIGIVTTYKSCIYTGIFAKYFDNQSLLYGYQISVKFVL